MNYSRDYILNEKQMVIDKLKQENNILKQRIYTLEKYINDLQRNFSLLIANETKNKWQKFITRFSKEKGLECRQDFNSFIISLVEYKKNQQILKLLLLQIAFIKF